MKTELSYLLEELNNWPDKRQITVYDLKLLIAQAVQECLNDKINQSYYESEVRS